MPEFNLLDWAPADDYWLVQIIVGILILSACIFLLILLFRTRHVLLDIKKRRFTSTLHTLLSKILNHPEEKQKHFKRLKKLVLKKWQREILLDLVINICYSFKGVYADRGREVYDYFNLKKYSTRKLKSLRWHKVVEGIIELSIIAEEDGRKEIIRLINDPNPQVRIEARIAIVEIGRIEGLIEMSTIMGKMSRWTYISILSVLQRSPFKLEATEFEILAKSRNPSMRKLSKELKPYATIN